MNIPAVVASNTILYAIYQGLAGAHTTRVSTKVDSCPTRGALIPGLQGVGALTTANQ